MLRKKTNCLLPIDDRGPLRVMFAITSMPVGGAETLLANLVRRMDADRFSPQICCLKEAGPLGEQLSAEVPVHANLLSHRLDLRIFTRLTRLIRARRTDAVVTVGAGDKMFWGRLAAWCERVPVIVSALHSTGWPDEVGRLNRRLTPITDAFIGVAAEHGRFLVQEEGFPQEKVKVIPNGVDVSRFRPCQQRRVDVRDELKLPNDAVVCGLVAAIRPEKNHRLFLRVAAQVRKSVPHAHFVLVGDGPARNELRQIAGQLQLGHCVHLLGNRSDVPEILSAFDVFLLTSDNEANPVSVLEAMACGLPVVATDVGSISESVEQGVTGCLSPRGDVSALSQQVTHLLLDRDKARSMGQTGRQRVVDAWSLERMVAGYQDLITQIYVSKCQPRRPQASLAVPVEV